MLNRNQKIFIAGHNGMVGSSILRTLLSLGYKNVHTVSRKKIDLLNQKKVYDYINKNQFDGVFIAAARVGGIHANNIYKPKFMYENLQIQNNLIHSSYLSGVKNLLFLGSSCIYPKKSRNPIKENQILTGPLEITNEAYALAKIAGVKMCEYYKNNYKLNYKSLMPCNIYGIGDNYDLQNSHFFPALLKKIHISKIKNLGKITIWGTGKPKRELIFVDDVAKACIHFMKKNTPESLINIGYGTDKSIKYYVNFIMKKLNYFPEVFYDTSKPDGTYKKLLDSSLSLNYCWKPSIDLDEGFNITYKDFLKNGQ